MTAKSIYEHLFPLTTVMRHRFADNWSGEFRHFRWTTRNTQGSWNTGMSGGVGVGWRHLQVTALINDRSGQDFANIRTYAHDNSVVLVVFRRVTADTGVAGGLSDSTDHFEGATANYAAASDDTTRSFKDVRTKDGTTGSITDSNVALGTVDTSYKLQLITADTKLTINGTLKVTKTNNLPTSVMQPAWRVISTTAATGSDGNIKYIEVYNT